MHTTHISYSRTTTQRGEITETVTVNGTLMPTDMEKLPECIKELKALVAACVVTKPFQKDKEEHPNNQNGH